jgi:hypothetical protein
MLLLLLTFCHVVDIAHVVVVDMFFFVLLLTLDIMLLLLSTCFHVAVADIAQDAVAVVVDICCFHDVVVIVDICSC